jgi:ABC-2 type transport system permease protein
MEVFSAPFKPTVIVDYAHTPKSLKCVLESLRLHCKGQLWCVFGCGGNRESTLPLKERDIVIGKYLAGLSLILLALLSTSVHYFTLINVASNVDHGAVFTGYLGLALLGGVYTAVGIFASSITENQVIAFIIGIAIVLVFFMMDKLLVFVPASLTGVVQYLSTEFHLSNISRGVIDSRNIIYFGSIIGFFLNLTTRLLESRKWS